MLWLVLILIVATVAALWFWNKRRDYEWRRELLYLTRHEGSIKTKSEKLDMIIAPILQSARHQSQKRAETQPQVDDFLLDDEDKEDVDQDDGLYDLPIFAQNAEAAEADSALATKKKNIQIEYFFPESVSVPFDEQFEPIFPKKNLEQPKTVEINTQSQTKLALSEEPEDVPVIEINDIRHHFKQKKHSKKNRQNDVPVEVQQVLPIIDAAEVWANLAKTDSPAPKVYAQRNMLSDSVIPVSARLAGSFGQILSVEKKSFFQSSRVPISTRFTPFANQTTPLLAADSNDLILAQNETGDPCKEEHIPVLNQVLSSESKTDLTKIVMPVKQAETQVSATVEPFSAHLVQDSICLDVDLLSKRQDQEDAGSLSLPEQVMISESITLVDVVPEASVAPLVPIQTLTAVTFASNSNIFSTDFLPNLSLLQPPDSKAISGFSEEDLLENGTVIEEKLAEFKVKVSVVEAYAGPVVTRYEIEPAVGVRGSQVVNLVKDLARALGFVSIRVVETIPGKTCMGLELPNPKRQIIRLSEILCESVFTESRSKLTLALGQDITGQPVVTDLAKAPHLLVAGTTGSGKSVGVNAMILSILYKATPDEVRLIMIDPKMLELSIYEGIPHLLAPVVTDMKLAANALTWCVNEMDKRYRLMSYFGVRNIAGFNQKLKEVAARGQKLGNPFSLTPEMPEPLEHLPFIVVVVDEFADLMMVAGKKIEELIARLAQKARAAGIHLILATQRPSVDVITGLIKANIPTRIAFQVSSKIDSRTILDQMGAESLLGQGDMLFLPPGTGYPQRIHGAFVADDEVHRIVTHLKQFGEPNYVADILTSGVGDDDLFSNANSGKSNAEDDSLYDEAVSIVVRTRKASISSVQRQLRIGYNRAARLIEQMETAGIVSSMENNGNRTVLFPEQSLD